MSHNTLTPQAKAPQSKATSQPERATQSQFKLWVWLLTLMVLGLGIVPIAKAAPLEELSGTLQQSLSNVTQQVLNPIGQLQQQVQGPIQQVEQTVGGLTQNLGNFGNLFGGATQQLGNLLNPFTQQFTQYLQGLSDLLNRNLSNVFGNIFGGANAGGANGETMPIPQETGDLGIPDFEAMHQAIEQAAKGQNGGATPEVQQIDRFNLNPLALAQSVKAETDRTLNRGMASAVVGKAGQTAMKQELQGAAQTLQSIQSQAQQAQGMDVTQDVMKNLTALQAGQSALQAGSYSSLMLLRQQEAANSLVMSNISDSVDESNRMQHSERMAGAASLLQASGNVYMPGSNSKK